jgi:phosphonate dehydrogenase
VFLNNRKIVLASFVHDSVKRILRSAGTIIENTNQEPWTRNELINHLQDADALMAFMTERIDGDLLDQCPKLKIIAGALKGFNNIDINACSERGIIVTIVPDLLTIPTAELTVGLMIALSRKIISADQYVRSGNFKGWRPIFFGNSVVGSNIGVIGAGAVGRSIFKMLLGFDCRCFYVDPVVLTPEEEFELNVTCETLEYVLKEANFVVLGMHLTVDSFHIIDREFLSKMKPGAYLINPARGSLVDEAAVADALLSGHLGGFATDTYETEDWAIEGRPGFVHPGILNSDKTVLTPHIGSAVGKTREAIELSAANSIISALKGEKPKTSVNSDNLIRIEQKDK